MGRTKRQHHIVRLFALALCLLLTLTALPGRALALSGTTGGLSWSLSGGTLRISGTGAMPNYTDGGMAPWYDAATAINRIVVEEGVTSVGSLAFYGCSTAVRATLPSTVTVIGSRVFKNCESLTYVTLPEGLESIGEAAFEGCEALNGIILPQSLRSIGNFAFDRCIGLTSIVIPSGVTELGMVVFYNCTGLTRAEIHCPVEKIPDWFFYGCTALTEVKLPETVTETGDQVFHNCRKLSVVHYSGTAAEQIADTLLADETTRYAEVNQEGGAVSTTVSSTTYNEETATSTTVAVTQTEQAIVTETTTTNYTYTVDGEEVTLEQAMTAEPEQVEVTAQANSTVTATVSGSDGWKEVTGVVKDAAANRSDTDRVEVQVQLTGSTLNGTDLSKLAGVDTSLTVSTSQGCSWAVDTAKQSSVSFGRGVIDLDFSVQLLQEEVQGIQSDTVYQVDFASDVGFNTTVGIPIKVDDTLRKATLFEKNSSGLTELTSTVVDENGYAWFPVDSVTQGSEYYVAIDEANAATENAYIPQSLQNSYGVNDDTTLTDASGKQYEVGERESRWGITGKQFTIYVVVVLGALVLITSGVMITLNKISKSKAKYAAMAAADEDDYEIDEEALRLQIMQEMLEEAKRKNSGGQ